MKLAHLIHNMLKKENITKQIEQFLKNFYRETIKKIPETIYSIIRTSIVVIILVLIVWLCGGRPDIYKSFQNILKEFVTIRSEPRSTLYTQFPHEYNLGEYGKNFMLANGEIMTINTLEKPIWVGIWNKENISLKNVLFILYMPGNVMLINENKWDSRWNKLDIKNDIGYFTQLSNNIQPERGAHFDCPIEVKFPKTGKYIFKYKYFCDDFSPKEGYFIINVV